MCNCTLSLKFLVCSKDRAYSENRNQRMRQVVAYRGLKNIGKSLTVRVRKWSRSLIYRGGGSLQEVPTVRLWLGKFWCFGLAVAYGRRSLTRANRTWRFDLYPPSLLQLLIPPIMQFFLSPSINWRLLTTLLFDERKMLYETFLTLGLFRLLFCRTSDQAVLFLFCLGVYQTMTMTAGS